MKLKTSEFYDYLDKINATTRERSEARSTLIGVLCAHASKETWKKTMSRVKRALRVFRNRQQEWKRSQQREEQHDGQ